MSANLISFLYLISGIFFILALRGLSNPESARMGNYFGIIGMGIAAITTLFISPPVGIDLLLLLGGLLIGGTIGLVIAGKFSSELMIGYIIAQVLGAMLGSWLTYLFYIDHYRSTNDESKVMGSFCTSPAIRNLKNNFFSEFLATFILIFGILYIVKPNILIEGMNANFGIGSLDALPVGILVWVIGLSLGGTTGYAINPARDLGPRIVYQLIPRKNKISDWAYSWVPVIGPSFGAVVAGLLYLYFN